MTVNILGYSCKKKLFYTLLTLLVIIVAAATVINRYWSPVLAAEVKSTLLTSTDSLYHIDFTDARLHVLEGKLIIYNITIRPNAEVYNRLKAKNLAPNNTYELHIKKLVLKNIHPLSLYFRHRLSIGQVIVSAPELHITYQLNHTHDTVAADTRTAWQRIKPMLKSIHVDEISLNDIKFRYDDYSGLKLNISELKEMNITAKDLLIDSATQHEKARFAHCHEVVVELNNYQGSSKNGLYRYQIKSLTFSTLTAQLNVYGLSLLPVTPEVFFKKTMHNRYSFYLDSLQANNFDYLNYNKYHTLSCSNLILSNGRLNFTSNAAIDSASKTDKLQSFPNVAIHHAHSTFRFDSVELHRIDVNFEAYSSRSKKTGIISFNRTYGLLLNVTSNREVLAKNNWCYADLTTWFMNTGRLDAQFKFNLTDSANTYNYQGSLGPMKMSAVNPAIRPLAMIELKSGQLNRLDFSVSGNRKSSSGTVRFLYNNLKVHVLRPDTLNEKFKHLTLATIFANALVVKHNNPDTTGLPARTYNVNYVRPNNAGFFKTIFKTLLPGIKASAGYDAAMEKKVKATIAERRLAKQQRMLRKALKGKKYAKGH